MGDCNHPIVVAPSYRGLDPPPLLDNFGKGAQADPEHPEGVNHTPKEALCKCLKKWSVLLSILFALTPNWSLGGASGGRAGAEAGRGAGEVFAWVIGVFLCFSYFVVGQKPMIYEVF